MSEKKVLKKATIPMCDHCGAEIDAVVPGTVMLVRAACSVCGHHGRVRWGYHDVSGKVAEEMANTHPSEILVNVERWIWTLRGGK